MAERHVDGLRNSRRWPVAPAIVRRPRARTMFHVSSQSASARSWSAR